MFLFDSSVEKQQTASSLSPSVLVLKICRQLEVTFHRFSSLADYSKQTGHLMVK